MYTLCFKIIYKMVLIIVKYIINISSTICFLWGVFQTLNISILSTMNEVIKNLGKKDIIGYFLFLSTINWIINNKKCIFEDFLLKETFCGDCLNWIINIINLIFERNDFFNSIWNSIVEYIMIVIFCKRQFNLNSSFSFAISLIVKNLHLPWIQDFRGAETTQDESSLNIQVIKIFSLLSVIYIEANLSKNQMHFIKRRLSSCIVGSELISIALVLKGLLANKFLLVLSNKFEKFEYTQLHCFYLRITVFYSLTISSLLSFINLGLTKKIIFKFYVLTKIFQSTKESIDIFSELNRFRKMSLSLNYSMSSPTQEELDGLSDHLCIICRDENTPDTCKKLSCGHIYHIICLQNWMVRQYCCPTCLTVISSKSKNPLQDVEKKRYEKNKKKTELFSFLVGCRTNIKAQPLFLESCGKITSLPSLEPDMTSMVFSKNSIFCINNHRLVINEKVTYLFVFEKLCKIRDFIRENLIYFSSYNFNKKSEGYFLKTGTFFWKSVKLGYTTSTLEKISKQLPKFGKII